MKKLFMILGLCSVFTLRAEVKFHPTLGDHMVLQQRSEATIHGSASPRSEIGVTCSWDGLVRKTRADGNGFWSVTVLTPAATAEPQTVTASGDGTATLEDVLIGEVWLCSGQSNMEMPMRGFPSQPTDGSLAEIMSSPRYRHLRLYTVGRKPADAPQASCSGEWKTCTPESVAAFSAVGYLFGKQLNETLGIPVGIVVSCYGGSNVEAWMSPATLAKYTPGRDYIPAEKADMPHRAPSTLYNGMLTPLLKMNFKGVVWYQGESNRSRAHIYARLLTDMIGLWRSEWNRPDMPFIICQICPYASREELAGALIMEAQQQVVRTVPGCSLVGTSDIGSPNFIHAPLKAPVARRAAAAALAGTYGLKGIPASGPLFRSVEFENGKALVSFDHTGLGLSPEKTDLDCFELAGEDRVFHPAKARVHKDRKRVVVSSEAVPAPVAVRFAFHSWHKTNLYNTEGLPAAPFRSDNW